jgi:integrase
MRRRRFQKGSLQERKHGNRRVWVVLYYDAKGKRCYHTLGLASKMNKSTADGKREEFMRTINGGERTSRVLPPKLGEFVEQAYLPFYRGKWKESTASTTENRIQHHIVADLGGQRLESFTLASLQQFLVRKAASGLSFSVVDHLRWDLHSIFNMAIAERVASVNPAEGLYTPRNAERGEGRAMTPTQVTQVLAAVDLRERVIIQLAIFTGLRPGELLAIKRGDINWAVKPSITIQRRVYRGDLEKPKNGKIREVAIAAQTAEALREWLELAVEEDVDAWVFASEDGTPLWRDNVLRRHIQPKLEPLGLGWVDFQVMRRTNASLGHDAKVDPKVSADQRGHGIGVSVDVYTKTTIKQKAKAAKQLEDSVLGRKAVTTKKEAA